MYLDVRPHFGYRARGESTQRKEKTERKKRKYWKCLNENARESEPANLKILLCIRKKKEEEDNDDDGDDGDDGEYILNNIWLSHSLGKRNEI